MTIRCLESLWPFSPLRKQAQGHPTLCWQQCRKLGRISVLEDVFAMLTLLWTVPILCLSFTQDTHFPYFSIFTCIWYLQSKAPKKPNWSLASHVFFWGLEAYQIICQGSVLCDLGSGRSPRLSSRAIYYLSLGNSHSASCSSSVKY